MLLVQMTITVDILETPMLPLCLTNRKMDTHPPTHTHTKKNTFLERETVNENVSFKVMNLLVQIFGISLH